MCITAEVGKGCATSWLLSVYIPNPSIFLTVTVTVNQLVEMLSIHSGKLFALIFPILQDMGHLHWITLYPTQFLNQ